MREGEESMGRRVHSYLKHSTDSDTDVEDFLCQLKDSHSLQEILCDKFQHFLLEIIGVQWRIIWKSFG